jgi:hypothetical protein
MGGRVAAKGTSSPTSLEGHVGIGKFYNAFSEGGLLLPLSFWATMPLKVIFYPPWASTEFPISSIVVKLGY